MTKRQDYKTNVPRAFAAMLGVDCWNSSRRGHHRSMGVHIVSICTRKMHELQVRPNSVSTPYLLGVRLHSLPTANGQHLNGLKR